MVITVLIVEDHALLRDGIRSILERAPDIDVIGEARTGDEAIRAVSSLQPDIVLMDIHMPGINGIEATRAITAAEHPSRVLVLTGDDDEAYIIAAVEAGAAGYLLKGSPADQLVSGIRAVHSGEAVLSMSAAQAVMRINRGAEEDELHSHALTASELEILRLVARGMENNAIAGSLGISARAVQYQLALVNRKLEVSTRTEAVVVALRRGFIRLEDI